MNKTCWCGFQFETNGASKWFKFVRIEYRKSSDTLALNIPFSVYVPRINSAALFFFVSFLALSLYLSFFNQRSIFDSNCAVRLIWNVFQGQLKTHSDERDVFSYQEKRCCTKTSNSIKKLKKIYLSRKHLQIRAHSPNWPHLVNHLLFVRLIIKHHRRFDGFIWCLHTFGTFDIFIKINTLHSFVGFPNQTVWKLSSNSNPREHLLFKGRRCFSITTANEIRSAKLQ